jgi:nucleosome binding factor SPN SPT16 subunit
MNKQAKERFLEQKGSSGPKKQKPPPPVAYKNVAVFPKEPDIRNLKLCVDRKYESVILPVHGFAAPFHISTIKNISRSEEGAYVYLRMNFFYPGAYVYYGFMYLVVCWFEYCIISISDQSIEMKKPTFPTQT